MEASTIITLVISVIGMFFGGAWLTAKGKISQAYLLFKEIADLLDIVIKAVEDDKVTKEETAAIKEAAEEVKNRWNKLIGKSE